MIASPAMKCVQPPLAYPPDREAQSFGPSEDEVRAQLSRIVSSADFVASARNRRFLEHIVVQTLLGHQPKGYEIGTVAFGRPSSFNPTMDPIVRIEASKLRRDLERYYLTAGKQDRVRISLPKGGYRADFSYNGSRVDGADCSGEVLVFLRVALLGWSGKNSEAANAWRALVSEYPESLPDAGTHEIVHAMSGGDEDVRELIVEGIRRASVSCDVAVPQRRSAVERTA